MATTGGNLLQRTRCLYFKDASKPCNKREPGTGCPAREGDHRNLAILGRVRALRRHPPVRHGGRAGRARTRWCGCSGPAGDRGDPARRPAPAARRRARTATPCCEHGELITAVDAAAAARPARSAYRKVRDRASYAFAVGSVAAALRRRGRRGPRRAARLRRGGAQAVAGPARPRRRCAAGPPPRESFLAAADAELAAAEPLRDNAFKVPLIRNLVAATLTGLELADDRRPRQRAVGRPLARIEGPDKVTGAARYAAEYPVRRPRLRLGGAVAGAARHGSTGVDRRPLAEAARARRALARQRARGWPTADDPELARAAVRPGQLPRAVRRRWSSPARLEAARRAAQVRAARLSTPEPHDTVLTADHPGLYTPDTGQPRLPGRHRRGRRRRGVRRRAGAGRRRPTGRRRCTTTRWSRTPPPRCGTATTWSCTTPPRARRRCRAALGAALRASTRARCTWSPSTSAAASAPRAPPRPNAVLAAMAARVVGRPVKLALTRQQLFSLVGYRTPTIQRVRLGADARRPADRASTTTASSRPRSCSSSPSRPRSCTRHMYAAAEPPHRPPAGPPRRADAALDAGAGRGARHVRPGVARWTSWPSRSASTRSSCGCATSPPLDPESGRPVHQPALRRLPARGRRAVRLGRPRPPAAARAGRALVDRHRASPARPTRRWRSRRRPGSARSPDGRFEVAIAATDIGTGARTVLTQIAADALGVPVDRVRVRIGDSTLPQALGRRRLDRAPRPGAGRCTGPAAQLRDAPAARPEAGLTTRTDDVDRQQTGRQARVRRPLRRGPGRRRHRRGAGVPAARHVRGRPDRQPAHRPQSSSSAA